MGVNGLIIASKIKYHQYIQKTNAILKQQQSVYNITSNTYTKSSILRLIEIIYI